MGMRATLAHSWLTLTRACGTPVNMDPLATLAFKDAREAWVRAYFSALFSATGGNVSEMARRAGMERSHVRTYIKRFSLRSTAQSVAA